MSSHCDLTFLRTFTGNDALKIKKYVGMFLGFAPQNMENMRTQLASSDWKALRTTAHSLKSQVKYMGIGAAEVLAVAIEKSAADETDLDQLPLKIDHLAIIIREASAELQEEINKI